MMKKTNQPLCLLMLACLLAAGCRESQHKHDAPHETQQMQNPVQQQNDAGDNSPSLQQVDISDNVLSAPKQKAGLVKLALPEPEKFTTPSGKQGWKLAIPGKRPLATPAVSAGKLYIGGGFGSFEFYVLDAMTGKPAWTFRTGDDGPTAAVVDDGCVAYNTESCILYVHDAETGRLLWEKWLGDPLMSQPAISGGRLYIAYPAKDGHHHLQCFQLKTGKSLWDEKIAGDLISAPVLAGGAVIAATLDGTLYAFDAATGRKSWSKECRVTSAPRVKGDTIIISQRSERNIEVADLTGNDKKSAKSTVMMEGLNTVGLETGDFAHAAPIAAIKAPYLIAASRQNDFFLGNVIASNNAMGNAFHILDTNRDTLAGIQGQYGVKAQELAKTIKALNPDDLSKDPAENLKNAQKVLGLADDIEAVANASDINEQEKKALTKAVNDLREEAGKTRDAADTAQNIGKTMAAADAEQKSAQQSDSTVGFSSAPETAKLNASLFNIGQGNVSSVWGYQGSRPCLVNGRCILVNGEKVRCLDPATGNVFWEKNIKAGNDATRPVTPPALAGGKLYLGTADGRIICMQPEDGAIIWAEKVGGRIQFELAVMQGRVYAATQEGTLICLDLDDPAAHGWSMWGGSPKHNGRE